MAEAAPSKRLNYSAQNSAIKKLKREKREIIKVSTKKQWGKGDWDHKKESTAVAEHTLLTYSHKCKWALWN